MKYRIVEMMSGDFQVQFYIALSDSWRADIDFSATKFLPIKTFASYNDAKAYLDDLEEGVRMERARITPLKILYEVEIDNLY
jgi:hypothetical protein